MRAAKCTLVRNAKRAGGGRATFLYEGPSAVEHLRNFLSALYNLWIALGWLNSLSDPGRFREFVNFITEFQSTAQDVWLIRIHQDE